MIKDNSAAILSEFFLDKSRVTYFLTNYQPNQPNKLNQSLDTLDTAEIKELLQCARKWQRNPTLYRSIKPELTRLEKIAEQLQLNSADELNTAEAGPYSTVSQHNVQPSIQPNIHPNIHPNIIPYFRAKPSARLVPLRLARTTEINPKIVEGGEVEFTDSASLKADETQKRKKNRDRTNNFVPTVEAIDNYFESEGLVGEKKTRELLIYGVLARSNLGIESLSGSGKSALLYALIHALPNSKYKIIHQASGKSLYEDPEMSQAEFWIIPELQKVFSQDIEEIIKNLTEGVDTTYTRVNKKGTGVDTFNISKKAVIYSFAITNRHLKARDDEFYRRFIILPTDISRRQNKEVALKFAETDFQGNGDTGPVNQFKQHLSDSLESKTIVRNPYLEYLVQSLPANISETIRFRTTVKHLQNLIRGCSLYYSKENYLTEPLDSHSEQFDNVLFSTFYDNQRVMHLYGQVMFDNIHGVSVVERGLLDLVQAAPGNIVQIMESSVETYGQNFVLPEQIDRLLNIGLLAYEGDELRAAPITDLNLNFEEALASADRLMKEKFPWQREQWHEKQTAEKYQKQINETNKGG